MSEVRMLRNGRLRDGRLVDLHVVDGRIDRVIDAAEDPGGGDPGADHPAADGASIDLGGWLVLPAPAEPHAHLDKAISAEMVPNPTGDLMGAIDAWVTAGREGRLTYADTVRRATAAMERLVINGVTAVRTHVDVMGPEPVAALRAVKEAAATFTGMLDVQTVALVSTPLAGADGAANRSALAAALAEGIDHVGGCPHLDRDGPGLIAVAIEAATEAGVGLDLHVDETLDADMLTLRDYATQILESGFGGLRSAGHCVSLGMQSDAVQAEVAALVAEASISIFALPQTNLFLQGRDDPTATPRGLTALKALIDHGVLVAAGADNVQDPFNLVGRSDPLETAALLVMAGHRLPDEAYDMVSNNVRRAIGMPEVRFEPGDPADLLVIDAPSVRGALADAPMSRRVFRRGRLVASADQRTRLHRP
ncbi:MAG: amidohydrolase family protein [Actinomycetota bacterium]